MQTENLPNNNHKQGFILFWILIKLHFIYTYHSLLKENNLNLIGYY